MRQSFKQEAEIIYIFKISLTLLSTTLGNTLVLLEVANGKGVYRMSQISQPSLSTKY